MQINLEQIDTDGAIAEAHEEAMGDTRLSFLKKAGIGAGAMVSGGAILGALAPSAMAAETGAPPSSFGTGNTAILNYALTLEYLESAFYSEAVKYGMIRTPRLAKFLATADRDEAQHVQYLKTALGSKAVAKPNFDFKGVTKNPNTFAATAWALENTGVHAYFGQILNITGAAYVVAAASILTTEARHSGAIGDIYDKATITVTGAFDEGYTASKVLDIVKSTGFIVS